MLHKRYARAIQTIGQRELIAAVAGVHQLPLLTRNPKDFSGLDTAVKIIGV